MWFLLPVVGGLGACGTLYGLHSITNATSIYVAHTLHGIERGYAWPPLSDLFNDKPQKHNGSAVGVLSAGTAAIATYVLVTKGMQGAVKGTGKLASPAKVESFAQLAKSLAPGLGQRGLAAVAAAAVAGAIRPIIDGKNMKQQ